MNGGLFVFDCSTIKNKMRGDFSFVKNTSDRNALEDAFRSMEEVRGSWEMMKTISDADFNNFERYRPLKRILERVKHDHTGNTGFWTFHKIRAIAVNGWDGFVEEYSGEI